ncbi:MAG: porin, partial [Burkholderiales bacterium]
MQKKAIAVAVAGALAVPAVAMAQSTVQVYGNLYIEHSFNSQGRNAAGTVDPANADVLQTGGSAIGFKGTEKLGGGMSAWFQCESTADPRGI